MEPWKILSDTVFKTPNSLITKIFGSQMGMFVYAIMSKWYIMVMLGSSVVAFWVFKGLEEAGVLSEAYEIVSTAMEDSKSIARYCTPKIKNPAALWECIQNPPKYQRTRSEQKMYETLEQENTKTYQNDSNHHDQQDDDPYASSSQ